MACPGATCEQLGDASWRDRMCRVEDSAHACWKYGGREGGVTWKLWLGLRDADMGVLVEEVVVVASEVIVRLALVTTKAKARVYETGSDVAGSESEVGMSRVVSRGDCTL